jgi:FkbM family methyltransferase
MIDPVETYRRFRARLGKTSWGRSIQDRRFLASHAGERAFYAQFIKPGALVFDVGANIGFKALVFQSLGARTVCIEPQPLMCDELRRRFLRSETVVIEQVALGRRPGVQDMIVCDESPAISTFAIVSAPKSRFHAYIQRGRRVSMSLSTLDELIGRHGRPDFCKIDVEGFELEVVLGLSQPLPMISLELNREFLPELAEAVSHLMSLGPMEANFSLGETNAMNFPSWIRSEQVIEWASKHPDPLLWGDLYLRTAGQGPS